MLKILKQILKIDIVKYLYYNYFCKNVLRKSKCKIIPYKHSIVRLSKKSKIVLDGNVFLNCNRMLGSKAETYFILNGECELVLKGDVKIRYGSTIQINNGARAIFNHFTSNVGINIQCNKEIIIGEDCMIGRNALIYDSAYHPTGTTIASMSVSQSPVHIGNHVWLGANSVIMQGSDIGDGSIIGTNACVSGKIAPGSFVSPNFDQPTISGMMWARSMSDLKDAEKYRIKFDTVNADKFDTTDVESKVYSILSSNITSVDFKNNESLIDSGAIDSLGLISIVALLEEKFSVKIPFTAVNADNFNSVHNIASLIVGIDNANVKSCEKVCEEIRLDPFDFDTKETEKSVVQRLMENALINPNDVAIIANEKETTYGELADMIVSVRNWLYENGARKGDCIAVQAIHEDICIALYYAIHLSGAKLVPVEKSAVQDRIREIALETKCKLIVSLKEENEEIWHSYDEVRSISHTIKFNGGVKVLYPDLDLPCEMIFTTGTTGKSKGVLMTHRHISWYAYSVAKGIGMKRKNRFLLTTPLNHAGGLRRTHLSLANGCCMVYMDGMNDLQKYFDYIERYKVTSLYLPPVAIRILLTRTGEELSKFKEQIDFVYSSSSPLPIGDCESLRKILPDTRLYNAYEASETPGVSAYNYNVDNILKNCMGVANDGVELAVLTGYGKIVTTPNIEGQICVKSKMNMQEYYMEPELTKGVWRDGWFVSNDLGYLDDQGNVYYNGRKGDVINIGGYKISPVDVEEIALLSGVVSECVCIESFDEFGVPYLKLLVVPKNDDKFISSELGRFLSSKLEAYKIPRRIERVDGIKRTFNGKIDRKAYRQT